MKNQRPGGLFGDWRYGWENTTLAEREQAQNVYDLGEAVEESNRLRGQQIREQQEQAFKQEQSIKAMADSNNAMIAQLIEEQRRTQRQQELTEIFRNLKITHQELQIFERWLNKEDTDTTNIISQITTKERRVQYLNSSQSYNCRTITLCNIEDKKNDLIAKHKDNNYGLTLISLLAGVCSIPFLGLGKGTAYILTGWAILFWILFIRSTKYQSKLHTIDKEIKVEQKKMEKTRNKINQSNNIEKNKINREIKELNQQLKQINEENKQHILDRWQDFLNFRLSHYNDDVERAIQLSKIPLGGLAKTEVTSEGTEQDYIDYIRQKLSE